MSHTEEWREKVDKHNEEFWKDKRGSFPDLRHPIHSSTIWTKFPDCPKSNSPCNKQGWIVWHDD